MPWFGPGDRFRSSASWITERCLRCERWVQVGVALSCTVAESAPGRPSGSTGCLERYAGKDAILTAAGLPPDFTPQDFAQPARSGESRAWDAVATAAWALGVALVGVINIVDIRAVVLGGRLGHIADLLQPELERHLRTRTVSARWVVPTIVAAEPDPAPGATGAAMLELSAVLADPAPWVRAARWD
jgi:predicted NBD/HSP70 family sugar kinase